MKLVIISDTHGMFEKVHVPNGDVFIHAGDIMGRSSMFNIAYFDHWLGTLPHTHKIVIAGNHDRDFETNPKEARSRITNAIYLEDEAFEIDGIKFYGSPWQPWFLDWAFNLPRGAELKAKWDLIPEETDVLITHGPSYGVLDQVLSGEHVGCEELAKAIARIKPKLHIFGHIHEGYGMREVDGCTHINASINTARYDPVNPAIVIDI